MGLPWVLGPSMVTRSGSGVRRDIYCMERPTSHAKPLESGRPSLQFASVSVSALVTVLYEEVFVTLKKHEKWVFLGKAMRDCNK